MLPKRRFWKTELLFGLFFSSYEGVSTRFGLRTIEHGLEKTPLPAVPFSKIFVWKSRQQPVPFFGQSPFRTFRQSSTTNVCFPKKILENKTAGQARLFEALFEGLSTRFGRLHHNASDRHSRQAVSVSKIFVWGAYIYAPQTKILNVCSPNEDFGRVNKIVRVSFRGSFQA